MTHTPGSWQIYIPEYDVTAWDEEAQQTVTVAIMADGEPNEIREANARLIAAAPDLLEACEVANLFFEENDDFTDLGEYPIPDFILDMRNAIKKARR